MGKGIEVRFKKDFGRGLEREVMRMAQGTWTVWLGRERALLIACLPCMADSQSRSSNRSFSVS